MADQLSPRVRKTNRVEVTRLVLAVLEIDLQEGDRQVDAKVFRERAKVFRRWARDFFSESSRVLACECLLDGPVFEMPVRLEVLRQVARDRRFREDDNPCAGLRGFLDQ